MSETKQLSQGEQAAVVKAVSRLDKTEALSKKDREEYNAASRSVADARRLWVLCG